MSKIKVKVIDILDDKYAIVKKSNGPCKLFETKEDTKLKINQTYLFLKSTEEKDLILQGNIKTIKVADMCVKDIQKDNKDTIRKLYYSRIIATSSREAPVDCIQSFVNDNDGQDTNSTDLQISGKVVCVDERDGQYGKYRILGLKDVEGKKILVMVYHKNCDLKMGDVVSINKLKYTNKQKENMDTSEKFVQTTMNTKMIKVKGMAAELFKNIILGDVLKEGKFSGISESKIYFSCENCFSKCSDEEPETPIKCRKCGKLTNGKIDYYIEIVLEDIEDVMYLVAFKRSIDEKEISEFKLKESEQLEEFIINMFDGKSIVFHANHDKSNIEGNKFIAIKLNIKQQ